MKKLCDRSSFCVLFLRQKPFFEVKSQNEPIPIAIKIHTHNILCINLLQEKWEGKVTQTYTFFKTNVTFPCFLPLILKYVKKMCSIFRMLLLLCSICFQFFRTNVTFPSFLPFILRYAKKCAQFSECYCYYVPYVFNFYQDYF